MTSEERKSKKQERGREGGRSHNISLLTLRVASAASPEARAAAGAASRASPRTPPRRIAARPPPWLPSLPCVRWMGTGLKWCHGCPETDRPSGPGSAPEPPRVDPESAPSRSNIGQRRLPIGPKVDPKRPRIDPRATQRGLEALPSRIPHEGMQLSAQRSPEQRPRVALSITVVGKTEFRPESGLNGPQLLSKLGNVGPGSRIGQREGPQRRRARRRRRTSAGAGAASRHAGRRRRRAATRRTPNRALARRRASHMRGGGPDGGSGAVRWSLGRRDAPGIRTSPGSTLYSLRVTSA